ncbi:NHL repeat protein [Burkholderiales bacterium JOSHI_001]|nr:NHL repeat protein [Burkholderiales bacterium JOSHI_001]
MRRHPVVTRRACVLTAALVAVGCAGPPEKPGEDDLGDRLWPRPPELPRFAWETDLRSAADIFEDSEEGRQRRLLTGERLPTERAFEKPVAVAARAGRIYVADSVRRHVVVFDVPRRKVFLMGLRAPGTLVKPSAMALDAQGNLYVADATLRKVLVYDALGLFLRNVGQPEELKRPTGVAVSPDGKRVYLVDRSDNDSDDHRVLAYDGQGAMLRQIGKRGSEPGQFNIPVQAAVAPDGTLWVLDAGNFRVQAFDPDGKYLRAFGNAGTGIGQFARPRGLACDGDGRLYVSDGSFGNVQVFNPQGELLIALGSGSRRDAPGRYGLPHGVAVDETGRVYVVDQLFNKVEVLRRVGEAEARDLVKQAAAAASR